MPLILARLQSQLAFLTFSPFRRLSRPRSIRAHCDIPSGPHICHKVWQYWDDRVAGGGSSLSVFINFSCYLHFRRKTQLISWEQILLPLPAHYIGGQLPCALFHKFLNQECFGTHRLFGHLKLMRNDKKLTCSAHNFIHSELDFFIAGSQNLKMILTALKHAI